MSNMISIFLAEDELSIRERIKNMLDWTAYGFDFLGAASDGELALVQIKKLRPDILLTDIRMPFVDGLELIKEVKKFAEETECIILSGYQDFDYARKAIEVGVSEYVLKPISSHELLLVLWRARQRVEKKKQAQVTTLADNGNLESEFLSSLLQGKYRTTSKILAIAGQEKIDVLANYYKVIFISPKDGLRVKAKLMAEKITEDIIDKSRVLKNSLLIDMDEEYMSLLLRADSDDELRKQEKYFKQLKAEVSVDNNELKFFDIFFLPKVYVNRLTQITKHYDETKDKYYKQKNANTFESITNGTPTEMLNGVFFQQNLDTNSFINKNLAIQIIKNKNIEMLSHSIREVFSISEESFKSLMYRVFLVGEVARAIINICKEIELEIPEGLIQLDELESFVVQNTTVEAFYSVFLDILINIVQCLDNSKGNNSSLYVRNACQYIENHFQNPDLNLNMVAKHVNVSPTYLSSLFSEELESSFTEYTNQRRLQEAKLLLEETPLRNQDISSKVGYASPTYFSSIFKRYFGVSPSAYRTSMFYNKKDEND